MFKEAGFSEFFRPDLTREQMLRLRHVLDQAREKGFPVPPWPSPLAKGFPKFQPLERKGSTVSKEPISPILPYKSFSRKQRSVSAGEGGPGGPPKGGQSKKESGNTDSDGEPDKGSSSGGAKG